MTPGLQWLFPPLPSRQLWLYPLGTSKSVPYLRAHHFGSRRCCAQAMPPGSALQSMALSFTISTFLGYPSSTSTFQLNRCGSTPVAVIDTLADSRVADDLIPRTTSVFRNRHALVLC